MQKASADSKVRRPLQPPTRFLSLSPHTFVLPCIAVFIQRRSLQLRADRPKNDGVVVGCGVESSGVRCAGVGGGVVAKKVGFGIGNARTDGSSVGVGVGCGLEGKKVGFRVGNGRVDGEDVGFSVGDRLEDKRVGFGVGGGGVEGEDVGFSVGDGLKGKNVSCGLGGGGVEGIVVGFGVGADAMPRKLRSVLTST
jgi:hypothetical protein